MTMLALLSGYDLIAVGMAAVVVLVALLWGNRRLELKVGQMSATVADAKSTIDDVNQAVNHRAAGELSLYDQVKACRSDLCDLKRAVDRHLAYHEGLDRGGRAYEP